MIMNMGTEDLQKHSLGPNLRNVCLITQHLELATSHTVIYLSLLMEGSYHILHPCDPK